MTFPGREHICLHSHDFPRPGMFYRVKHSLCSVYSELALSTRVNLFTGEKLARHPRLPYLVNRVTLPPGSLSSPEARSDLKRNVWIVSAPRVTREGVWPRVPRTTFSHINRQKRPSWEQFVSPLLAGKVLDYLQLAGRTEQLTALEALYLPCKILSAIGFPSEIDDCTAVGWPWCKPVGPGKQMNRIETPLQVIRSPSLPSTGHYI